MDMLDLQHLISYWSGLPLQANFIIAMNLLGALALGMLVGYERAYNGRAAGMRTYGLVCMASCALTVLVGYAPHWFGGFGSPVQPDPTRVVQGIVSGIGFLCAGVIMKDGLSINGLTTAASLWAAAATGVMVGVGFYAAAIILACLSMLSMTTGRVIQARLPSIESLGVELTFRQGQVPKEEVIVAGAAKLGYVANMSRLSITSTDGQAVWRFPIETKTSGRTRHSRARLAKHLAAQPYIQSFSLEPSRH